MFPSSPSKGIYLTRDELAAALAANALSVLLGVFGGDDVKAVEAVELYARIRATYARKGWRLRPLAEVLEIFERCCAAPNEWREIAALVITSKPPSGPAIERRCKRCGLDYPAALQRAVDEEVRKVVSRGN